MQNKPKYLLLFSRLFVGILFIFSGLIKINDPIGFGYKLQEYFEVFKLYFLVDFSTLISLFLCALEIVLGVLLLFGVYAKKVAWGLFLLIIFFTVLTFSSAVFKIVTSCGCFGDAIPLTPWQSFGKDLILLVFILVIFKNRNQIQPLIKAEKNFSIIISICSVLCGVFTLYFEPVIDFLPYKKGANLPSLMKIPEGAPVDEYEITYHLKNKATKAEKDLTDKEYMRTEIWKDTLWVIEGEPKQKLIKKGFQLKIKDLKITQDGNDITETLLQNPFPVFWLVSYELQEHEITPVLELIQQLTKIQKEQKIRFIILSAVDPENMKKKFPFLQDVELYFVDAVPLKSMIRTQPGVLLIENGTILNKWNFHTFPKNSSINTFIPKP